ncbi:hypothetical protein [Hyalangium gracile]|uniref:hypothetical protein n=1 Tax=Hyalangium gracile TaxID=394092 RepID=UPI001CCC9679|nr:hypothetical protein [Hyalangium gracile]
MANAPKAGDAVLGEPFDPQLAAVYHRFGAADFGPLSLYGPGSESLDLIPWNERLRELDAVQFRSSLIFGRKTGFSLYFATVPRLATPEGLQPVVYIEAVDALTCVPVASSVDRFFDTYSRYLELMVVDPEYIASRLPESVFPWSVPHLIAHDEPLVAQVRAGAFDFLTPDEDLPHPWVQKLRTASP